MWNRLSQAIDAFLYSFPIRLVIHHFRRSPVMMVLWLFYFLVVTGNLGQGLGIPYLFLDPEYMSTTGFLSFAWVGLMTGGFIMAFHITSYINDGYRFNFLGTLKRPFSHFALNNSVIPLLFMVVYITSILRFQLTYEINTTGSILLKLGGFFTGFVVMTVGLIQYFRLTNLDAFKILTTRIEKRLKKSRVTRATLVKRLAKVRGQQVEVKSYLDFGFKIKPAYPAPEFLQKRVVAQVFNQNHFNAVLVELGAVALILVLGAFQPPAWLQIPAAASAILTGTVLVMILGAVAFWSRGYTTMVVVFSLILLNVSHQRGWLGKEFEGLGLDYEHERAEYSLATLAENTTPEVFAEDYAHTIQILENWRAKFPANEKPKMVFVASSGGGQRSALWTVTALQAAQQITSNALMEHTMLMTGSSGGLIGSAYFRELLLQSKRSDSVSATNPIYQDYIAKDNLNSVIFSMLVNDMFFRNQEIAYAGQFHPRDRGVAFEEALNQNTRGYLNKCLAAYRQPEITSTIPMLLVTPSITTDGRRLYISPQPVSYFCGAPKDSLPLVNRRVKGIDFGRFFREQHADSLRFLSALRMGATFPYITPNISLPSSPSIQIMDSGLSDNFGIRDAVRFVLVFREWISENTSGVIFLSVRDSEKDEPIVPVDDKSLLDKIVSPITAIYNNWSGIQDLDNDDQIELSQAYLDVPIHRVRLQYIPRALTYNVKSGEYEENPDRATLRALDDASLSWRLTTREAKSIRQNIQIRENQQQLQKLKALLSSEN